MNEWEWQLLEEKLPSIICRLPGIEVKAGSRVRLRPRQGGDVMDIALAGQIATIECIEQDYEGKCHVCVVLENDPGRDMGLLRQPGHRFFFDAEEIEPLSEEEARETSVSAETKHSDRRHRKYLSRRRCVWRRSGATHGQSASFPTMCEWSILESGDLIWPTLCRMDTKPQSWWMRVRTGSPLARSTSSSPI